MANIGTFHWGPIGPANLLQAAYTETLGTSPSIFAIEVPVETFVPAGTFHAAFRYGPKSKVYPQCKLKKVNLQVGPTGQTLMAMIEDRRWLWRTGQISGTWNATLPNGELDSELRKTPQELATLCLKAMNETNFNVGSLPNNTNPAVVWEASNPAQALESLCTKLGCRIAGGATGRVRIVRTGEGNNLPDDYTSKTISFGVDPPKIPDSVLFVGGITRWEAAWETEAVGLDEDGEIKPVDELSYKPSEGWEGESLRNFYNVVDEHGKKAQALAKRSVFKWYRLKGVVDNPFQLELFAAGLSDDLSLKHVLPVETGLAASVMKNDGNVEQLPAEVTGIYWDKKTDFKNTELATTAVNVDFSINSARGIVEFSEPVYKVTEDFNNEPAELYATLAFPIRKEKVAYRFSLERRLTNSPTGTGPHVIRRDEVVRIRRATYIEGGSGSPPAFATYTDNLDEVNQEATYYIEAFLSELQTLRELTVEYADLKDIALDGAIQQVSYSVNRNGTVTRASRNTEHDLDVPSYRERVSRQKVREITNVFDANQRFISELNLRNPVSP